MKKLLPLLTFLFVFAAAGGQTKFDPTAQISWPKLTGSGTPVAVVPCTATNYGQPYFDTTNTLEYKCAPSGWVKTTASGVCAGSSPQGQCNLGNTQVNIGTASGNLFTMTNLSTITTPWTMDVTSPTTAIQSMLPGVVPDGTNGLKAKTIGGLRYASQWGNGTTNGISSAAATNQLVVADPSYPTTEQPGPFSFTTSMHYLDQRNVTQSDLFINPYNSTYNPLVYPMNTLNWGGRNTNCLYWLLPSTWSGNSQAQGCNNVSFLSNTPGYSFGNPSGFGAGAANGWQNSILLPLGSFIRGAGIHESMYVNQEKTAKGDNAAIYINLYGQGGRTAPSDESNEAIAANIYERPAVFSASCSTGCTTGSTSIKTSVANGYQGSGRYLYDSTQAAVSSGHVTAIAGGLASGLSAVTIDGTVTPSVAWGTISGTINVPVNTQPPFTTTETYTITSPSGTFDTTNLLCFAGNFHEQVRPTAVTNGASATITVAVRNLHASGTMVMQGGMCGTGLEFTAFTYNGYKYLYDVIGSTDAHTLQATAFVGNANGPQSTLPIPANTYQTVVFSNATSSSGTTVSFTTAGGGTLYHPWTWSGNSYVLSGASDSALNALCTGTVWTTTTTGTCTIAGLSGTHTTTTAITATQNLNGYNLYNIAEVTDVQNEILSPPQVDGTLALEPNNIAFTTSDTVVETHHYSATWHAYRGGWYPMNPFGNGDAIYIGATGKGVQGGATSVSSAAFININNQEPHSTYRDGGGSLFPPNAFNMQNDYNIGFDFSAGPANEQSVLYINPTSAQYNNQTYNFQLAVINHRSGAFSLADNPYTGNITESTNGLYSLAATGGYSLTTNAAASVPGAMFSGNIFTGGTGTTTMPFLYLFPTNSSAVTSWSTNGTMIGITSPGAFSGNWVDIHNGSAPATSVFSVASDGSLSSTGNVNIATGKTYQVNGAQIAASNLSNGTTGSGAVVLASALPTKYSPSLTPSAVTASTCAEQTFTVTGLTTGQGILAANPPSALSHVWIGSKRVSAANTLAVEFCGDATGGTPPSGTWTVVAF